MITIKAREGLGARSAVLATLALTAGALATAGPALAANPPVAPHSIISFPQRDFVSATGYAPGDEVVVDVLRNGHLLATSTPVTPQDDPKVAGFDGLVEVNHPGGGCWIGSTPDIRPGDDIRTTILAGGAQDATTTANVTAQAAIEVSNNVVVHGTAQDATGAPLPLDQIEQRIVANQQAFLANGRRTLRAGAGLDGTLAYDAPGSTSWTATYTNLDPADVTRALGAETRILWLGADPAAGVEATIYETSADPAGDGLVGGPATPDCTAPAATTAVIRVDRTTVNAANVATPMVLDGVSTPDITGVDVHVPGGAVHSVVPTADGTWTTDIPAADLGALGQGGFNVGVHYTSAAGIAPPDEVVTLRKDTIRPPAPHASPDAGAYDGTQVVTLADAEADVDLLYTNDGSLPTNSHGLRFTAPIVVTATQTITAVAVDRAGNESAPGAFTFSIGAATASGGAATRAAPAGGAAPVSPIAAPVPSVALRALNVPGRVRVARLRSGGLRLTMTLGDTAHVVRVRLFRAGSRTALLTAYRVPARDGAYALTLRSRTLRRLRPGRYRVEVAAGDSARTLGAAVTRPLRVTR